MKIAVIGNRDWTDYNHVMRTLTVAIQDWRHYYPEDKVITFVHTGNEGAERMITEYVGKVEDLARQNGYKIDEYPFRSSYDRGSREALEELLDSGITWSIIFAKGRCSRCDLFAKLSKERDIDVAYEKA